MTHDLMIQLLGELCMRVHRVTITSLLEGTFYAEITIADNQGHEWQLDSRPSDAIALALRHEAGIFVSRAVLTEAGGFTDANEPEVVGGKAGDEGNAQLQRVLDEENSPGDSPSGSAARAKPAPEPPNADVLIDSDTRLEDLDPETFGKYKM